MDVSTTNLIEFSPITGICTKVFQLFCVSTPSKYVFINTDLYPFCLYCTYMHMYGRNTEYMHPSQPDLATGNERKKSEKEQ